MLVNRRGILVSLFAAPAIIAIDRLMPVKALANPVYSFPDEMNLKTWPEYYIMERIPYDPTWYSPNPTGFFRLTAPDGTSVDYHGRTLSRMNRNG